MTKPAVVLRSRAPSRARGRGRLEHPRPRVRQPLPPFADDRLAGDGGTAIVELALILPFLAVMVFGTIDLGRAFALKNRVTNMAREGAHYAQFNSGRVNCSTGLSIRSVALAESSVSGATVRVRQYPSLTATTPSTPDLSGCSSTNLAPGVRILVEVSAPMQLMTPLITPVTGTTVTVRGWEEVVMQG
jgi:Flp pilus assembly protein TadG